MGARLHPLDCPIWTALTTHQASFGEGGPRARRFHTDVSPFFAAADDGPASVSALAALVHEDDDLSLLERAPPAPPPGIALRMNAQGLQMVARAFTKGGREPQIIIPLGDRDAPEMVALAELTRPGPFRVNTHKLGRFIGVRDGTRLIAMAGERMHADDFVEISAVCTHPDYRGRGYGAALMRVVGQRILSEGAIPFLHTYTNNVGAIKLYRKLGFEARCEVTHAVWSRDAG